MPDPNWLDRPDRRNFLRYGAAGSAALIAGCSTQAPDDDPSGNDSNNTDTTTTSGGDNGGGNDGPSFKVFDPSAGVPPDQRHLNPWNPTQSGCWHPGANIFDRGIIYSPTRNTAYPLVAKDWEMTDDTTLEFTMNPDFQWHNGDQLVAEDWVTQMQIGLGILRIQADEGDRPHPLIDSAEAPDSQTVRVHLHEPLSTTFAVQNAAGSIAGQEQRGIFTKHDREPWTDWLEGLKNGREGILTEITSSTEPTLADGLANGPFQVSELGGTSIWMEPYDDHPNAGNIEIDNYRLEIFNSGLPVRPYMSGDVDAAHSGFPIQESLRDRLPEGHTLFREGLSQNKLIAFNCGYNLSGDNEYNHDATPFADPEVRRAFAHVFDRSEVSQLLDGVNRVFQWAPCRVPGKVLEEGDHQVTDWVDSFVQYGNNNTERAAELLRSVGYERSDGGNWLTPEGERFEVDWMGPAQRRDHQVFIKNITDFGIKVNASNPDSAVFDERRVSGNYHAMTDGSSANGITAMWQLSLVPNWLQSITHYKPTVEIPMPVGDPEGSNGTKEINVEEWIRQWQVTGEEQYHKELMWWWNQYLPEMELMYQPDAGAYNGGEWEVEARDAIMNGVDDALYLAPKMPNGTIRPK